MKNQNWNNNKTKELFKAIMTLKNIEEATSFCRDLMTEAEIEELALRLSIAKALFDGATQRKAAAVTGASIATVTRVNRWLTRGMDGYNKVIFRLELNDKKPFRNFKQDKHHTLHEG